MGHSFVKPAAGSGCRKYQQMRYGRKSDELAESKDVFGSLILNVKKQSAA